MANTKQSFKPKEMYTHKRVDFYGQNAGLLFHKKPLSFTFIHQLPIWPLAMWREEKVLDVNANVYSNLQLYLANKFIYNKAAPSNINFITNLSQDNNLNLEKKASKSSGGRRQIPIDGAAVCFGSELEIIYGN